MANYDFECPYCGDIFDEGEEYFFADEDTQATVDCGCGKTFNLSREFYVHYDTTK